MLLSFCIRQESLSACCLEVIAWVSACHHTLTHEMQEAAQLCRNTGGGSASCQANNYYEAAVHRC